MGIGGQCTSPKWQTVSGSPQTGCILPELPFLEAWNNEFGHLLPPLETLFYIARLLEHYRAGWALIGLCKSGNYLFLRIVCRKSGQPASILWDSSNPYVHSNLTSLLGAL